MNTENLKQGTDEWRKARLGLATASRIADVIAKGKGGQSSASRANYLAELVAERLTGESAEHFHNRITDRGNEVEPQARAAYAFLYNAEVKEVGFVMHPRILQSGGSPDGLVGDDGLIQIKCPNTATYIDAFLYESIPGKYLTQMQWEMACTGRQWCDFVCFDPRMPADMQLFVKRVARDERMITSLEVDVRAFLADVDATVQALVAKAAKAAA